MAYSSLLSLGNVYYQRKRHDAALSVYRRAIAVAPALSWTYNNLGNVYGEQGRSEEAIAAYERAIQREPEEPDFHRNQGIAYEAQGLLDQAAAKYRDAIQLQPDLDLAHNSLGYIYLRQNKLDEALEELEEATRLDPNRSAAVINLSLVRYRQGDSEAGVGLLHRALELCTGHDLYDRLGRTWLRVFTGEKKRGLEETRRLLVTDRPPPGLLQDFITDTELLARSPQPPEGVDTMLALLREAAGELRGT